MGVRTLAKLIAPLDVESQRKTVRRWLKGTKPTRASRDRVTDALGLERGTLDPDDDEEEDVFAPLMRAVRSALADEEVRDTLRRALADDRRVST